MLIVSLKGFRRDKQAAGPLGEVDATGVTYHRPPHEARET